MFDFSILDFVALAKIKTYIKMYKLVNTALTLVVIMNLGLFFLYTTFFENAEKQIMTYGFWSVISLLALQYVRGTISVSVEVKNNDQNHTQN